MPDQSPRPDLTAGARAASDLLAAHVARGTLPCAILGVSDATGTLAIHTSSGPGWTVRPDSVCFLASVTKPIVASAVLQLVDEGRLDLDAPLHAEAPGRRGRVTARHVLTHTSGIPDVDLAPLIRRAPSFGALLDLVRRAEPVTEPGTRYAYASDSFMLLAERLASATGLPFAAALERRLLAPLGMHDTGFDPGVRADRVLPVEGAPGRSAIGRRVVRRFLSRATFAGGGLFGTTEDLLRFGRAILAGPGAPPVLSSATLDEMTRDHTLGVPETIDGLDRPAPGYGLGWGRPRADGPRGELTLVDVPIAGAGSRVLTHGGVSGTRLWVDRDRGVVIVILSARWGVSQVPHAETIAAVMRGLPVD